MIRNRAVLNSDSINRYGYKFVIKALEDTLDQKATEGVPTCLGHDMHRPLGWTTPFGLYFEPGLCRLVGNQIIAETDDEQEYINSAHKSALLKRYKQECEPYIDDLKQKLGTKLSDEAKYMYTTCVCCRDTDILERVFPDLFEGQDKDGLIYLHDLLKEFTYLGQGVFANTSTGLAVFAHQYFRKSLSLHNNLNYFFLDELMSHIKDPEITIRIALDRHLIGLSDTFHEAFELEYWRGPMFDDDVSKIKLGVTVYGSSEFQRLYYGISQSEFWWKIEGGKQTFEAEELKEHPSRGINSNDDYGCRYVHSIFDENTKKFEHFDGAIRMYSTEKMLKRIETDIKGAGKDSDYTKLFRIDGQLPIPVWKALVCHYYQSNPLIHEYFGLEKENETFVVTKEVEKDIVETLVPYSMDKGDGIRLFVSYHPIEQDEETPTSDWYISGYDLFSTVGENSIRVIESDIIEIRKALSRHGGDLVLPADTYLACAEDLYWNIPTISHRPGAKLEENISRTLTALKSVVNSFTKKNKDKVLAFTVAWNRDDKLVKVSVIGHCNDVENWLKQNARIPVQREQFRDWLERQSQLLSQYPQSYDYPSLFEMVCSDGVLYIRRRGIDSSIKYELRNQKGVGTIIKFWFPRDQFALADAYEKREIDVALGYILNETKCSKCNSDYRTCPDSKYLDSGVSEIVTKAFEATVTWTNRKA